jgi:DNA-binding PadR family transcriptional regulator
MDTKEFDNPDSDASEGTGPKEPRPPTELTGFQRDLLVVLEYLKDERAPGVTIRNKLGRYHENEVNHGRLYQNLSELVDEGYVEKRPLDGRTNTYRLSETGRKWLLVYFEWIVRCIHDDDNTGQSEATAIFSSLK